MPVIQTSYSWPKTPTWLIGVPAGRKNFLSAVPLNLQETTCRCMGNTRHPGWNWEPSRNMWVCSSCRKPSPAHGGYNVQCLFGCEELFTIWKFPVDEQDPITTIEDINAGFKQMEQELCMECGGNNDARLYS